MAGGPDRPHPAGIAVFTGGLRESMIVEAETHEVDGTEVSRGISPARGGGALLDLS
jgi:hypothetical protein